LGKKNGRNYKGIQRIRKEMIMDAIETLVKHVINTTFEDLPTEVVSVTKKSVIDTLGVTIAGSSVNGCKLLVDYIREWEGRKESTIAVFGDKVPCSLAAQANGAMARALEIDDVIDMFPLHPSGSIIPACLAVAERQGEIRGKDFITAAALGHDLAIRLALSVKVSPIMSGRYNLFEVFSFTGSVGKLLGLSEDQLHHAMGIAYSQMVGDGQAAEDGAMTSYIQQGTRAKSAIEAALMAQKGITGTKNVLEGQRGFFNAYEPDSNLEVLNSGLGTIFRGLDLSVKLHSSCRLTHEAIDVAQRLRDEGLKPDQIDQIVVKVNDQCFGLVCQPVNIKHNPKTPVEAQFSLPYTTAAAFIKGDVFIDEVSEEAIKNREILDLTQRIIAVIDPSCQTGTSIGSTIMEVKTRSGETLIRKMDFPKGNPKNPASMNDCIKKFRKCVGYSLLPFPERQVEKIVEIVSNLENLEDITLLAELLSPKPDGVFM
jgi:2-methylcitrate dehydratase PrpD